MNIQFFGTVEFESSDSGTVLAARLGGKGPTQEGEPFAYCDLVFVDAPIDPTVEPKHQIAELFRGKQVVVTIETLEARID